MTVVKLFFKSEGRIKITKELGILQKIKPEDFVWVDMIDPDPATEKELEDFFNIYIQTDQQIEEIESSSRYIETEDYITANSNFLVLRKEEFAEENISLIVKDNLLVSVRNNELNSFSETQKKILSNPKSYINGFYIIVALFETRIDYDADLIENITKEISELSKSITTQSDIDEDLLLEIKNLQEKTMMIRENIIDKQRVVSSMLKSEQFPSVVKPKLTIIIKDINSLIDHIKFGFERLEYLQDTFLGLVNIEQNKIIKIFTVVSVIFMPPTLIASIYGMNFKFLPELDWKYGYTFSISLMILASAATLLVFKKKKWL
jgi:magnesium transporter